jgi:hypothetical protein
MTVDAEGSRFGLRRGHGRVRAIAGQSGVDLPAGAERLPLLKLGREDDGVAVWWVGVHGGAGESYRYVVEGSFDAYTWQTVERKARFITQVMSGRLEHRQVEDIGDNALSFAEVKALAAGDMLILEHAQATAELTRLSRLKQAWQHNYGLLRDTINSATSRRDAREQEIQAVTTAIARRTDTRGEKFAMTFKPGNNNTTLRADDRKHAGQLINQWARTARPGRPEPLAELGGQLVTGTIRTDPHMSGREIVLTLHGLPSNPARTTTDHTNENPLGPIRQLEHRINDLEQLHARLQNQAEHAREEHNRATEALRKPFKHAEHLVAARDHLTQITAQMRGRETAQTQARDTTPEPPTPTPCSPKMPSPAPLSPPRPQPESATEHRATAAHRPKPRAYDAGRGRDGR